MGANLSLASMRRQTASTIDSPRSTSPPKSAWPGVSMMLIVTPPGWPIDEPGLHVLYRLDDAWRLRHELRNARRVAVVGAGLTGCEVAHAVRSLARECVLVDPRPQALVRPLGEQVVGPHRTNVLCRIPDLEDAGGDPHPTGHQASRESQPARHLHGRKSMAPAQRPRQ